MKYDWIEIGTANFNTLCQSANESGDPIKGLSIEPLIEHLNELPNVTGVDKINVAMSDYCGEIQIWWIPLSVIKENKLHRDWRGCNSVGEPHPTVLKKLGEKYYDFAESKNVPVWNWEKLIREKNIEEIGYLKIDTEGHDPIIMKDYIKQCKLRPKLWADKIQFENNRLSNTDDVNEVLELVKGEYNIKHTKHDIILTKK